MHYTAKSRLHPSPSRSSSSCSRKSPAVPGHPVWVSRGDHRRKSSSAPWSSLADVVPMVQVLDIPGPQGGIRWRCCGSSTCRLSSRSSQCPRSLWTGSPSVSAIRRPLKAEQLVEVPTEPGYSLAIIAVQAVGRSGSWTFQFLRFGGGVAEIFKVYEQDSVQQQRTWRRPLIFQLAVEVFKGFRPGQGSTASSSSRLLDNADDGIR